MERRSRGRIVPVRSRIFCQAKWGRAKGPKPAQRGLKIFGDRRAMREARLMCKQSDVHEASMTRAIRGKDNSHHVTE